MTTPQHNGALGHPPSLPDTEPRAPLKSLIKRAMARLARPLLGDAAASLGRIERRLDSLVSADEACVVWRGGLNGNAVGPAGLEHATLTRKYREELTFWDWLINRGGCMEKFSQPFAPLFGSWQRLRAEELRAVLGLGPEAFDAWCAQRTAVEIGSGPFPAVAVAPWRRPIAADPLAEGYLAQHLIPDEASHVLFMTSSGEHIPLPAQTADIVIIENCLDHVGDPAAALRETRRILKPAGHLWLLVDLMTYRDEMHPNPFTAASLRDLLTREGFTAIHERTSTERKSHPNAFGEYRGLLAPTPVVPAPVVRITAPPPLAPTAAAPPATAPAAAVG